MAAEGGADDDASRKQYNKLLSRNEELSKQVVTLRKEYTTLLRKISSIHSVLEKLDNATEDEGGQEEEEEEKKEDSHVRIISERSMAVIPELKWYNDKIKAILATMEGEFTIPAEVEDVYAFYRETPLLHTDAQQQQQ